MVECLFFLGIENNNRQDAAFPEAGLDLKVTPLKELKDKDLVIKERQVCTMIEFTKEQAVSFGAIPFHFKMCFYADSIFLHKEVHWFLS